MGGVPSINPFTVTFFLFFPIIILTTTLILFASAEDHETKENTGIPTLEDDNGGAAAAAMSLPPASSTGDTDQVVTKSVSFKPSTTVIVSVLATTFLLAILLLLYIQHCNGGNILFVASDSNLERETELQERKNSGIGRTVVDLLPAFKFGSLRGQKQGLECSVCLTGFEDHETLRLLPKCKHAFHMECVDTWLDEHSTCPLCRYKVDPDDISLPQRVEEELLSLGIESGRNTSNINSNESRSRSRSRSQSRQENESESIGSRRVSHVREMNSEVSLFSSTSSHSRKVKSESVIGEHRLDHRIILSPTCSYSYTPQSGVQQRWSNFETGGDMLYLTSDRIISCCSSSSRDGRRRAVKRNRDVLDDEMENGLGGGRNERDLRSTVSEMTGMMRFLSRDRRRERERRGHAGSREEQEQLLEGVASRWRAWISRSQKSHRLRSNSE